MKRFKRFLKILGVFALIFIGAVLIGMGICWAENRNALIVPAVMVAIMIVVSWLLSKERTQ